MYRILRLTPDMKVLEMGLARAISGVLAHLTPHVYTIEIVRPLAETAQRVLREQGYTTSSVAPATAKGWPEAAPFDVIIVTCAAERCPSPSGAAQARRPDRHSDRLAWGPQELVVVSQKLLTATPRPRRYGVRFVADDRE